MIESYSYVEEMLVKEIGKIMKELLMRFITKSYSC